jgi:hypothetical protein
VERKGPDPHCPGCAELKELAATLVNRIEVLEAALCKANKDSSTSRYASVVSSPPEPKTALTRPRQWHGTSSESGG